MSLQLIKYEVESIDSRWNKLLFVCENMPYKDREMALQLNVPYINLSLKLSERLKGVPKSRYALKVVDILENIFFEKQSNIYWLGEIAILFDKQLHLNPVRLLENMSKRYKLIVSWPGESEGRGLSYAKPGHPEFFTCDETDGKILSL
ncbi:BREX-3 system P-loop-containing protein BrxF [Priestia megaterium]|uniref:BREX-3 system P-loop-containing protein BrxF n=1 Tax=Priestia megaterium TaxID=1404 RepID=UPI0039FC1B38